MGGVAARNQHAVVKERAVGADVKRISSYPLLLYHLLSIRTLPFWTIFSGVLSSILIKRVSLKDVIK